MKLTKYYIRFILFLLSSTIGINAMGQVTVTSSDSLSCTTPCTVLTAHLTGDAPTDAGITVDDIYSVSHPIGFPFNFYGTTYTDVVIGPNGTLCFDLTLAGAYDPWPISAVLLGNPSKLNNICGPWCDIDISIPGGGTITYSLTGIAPFRKYIVTFCNDAMFSCTTQRTSTQIILYETTNNIECHIATKPICAGWNGGRAIIGVQNATGTAATVAPGRDFPASYLCTDEAWRFTPDATVSSYTVASIPYAPIPYASSLIYWYNATTGTFLGTGLTQTVCPTVPTTYRAGAIGCADTSFGYYTVTPSPSFTISLTPTNPTMCEVCDGTITVSGFTPGLADTITYDLGGVPQPPIYAIGSGAGTVTITGLCDGTYSNFVGHQGICETPAVGPVVLTNPPISCTVAKVDPSLCGVCDGTITISGLYPGHAFTINYDFNSVAHAPISATTDALGRIVLSGLCAGVYSNIVASYSTCITPPAGPVTLLDPPISLSITPVDQSICGACDGSLIVTGLYPSHVYTISYTYNGVPRPPFATVTDGSGNFTIYGLCEGTYTNFIASFGACATPAAGPYSLNGPPPPPGNVISFVNPTECGKCDGVIRIKSLNPSSSDTVFYSLNSVPQTPFVTTALPDSTIYVPGLCEGLYSNISVKIGHCITTIFGSPTLVAPPLTAAFDTTFRLGCNGDSVFFHNHSSSAGGLHYVWNFGDGQSDTATNPLHLFGAGTFTVTLLATNGYCVDSAQMTFTLGHPIKADFTRSPAVICQHESVTFTNSSTGATNYLWQYGNAKTDTASNPVYVYDNMGAFNIKLIAANNIPCYDTAYGKVEVDTISGIRMELTDSVMCAGTYITLTGLFADNGNTGITWSFGPGDTLKDENPVHHAFGPDGQYTVWLNLNYRACPNLSVKRIVTSIPPPYIDLGRDTSICKGSQAITLSDKFNAANPLASWLWSGGQKGKSILVTEPGVYFATVTINNCSSTDSVKVINDCYVNIPNIFTPNGDGINDFFFPRQLLTKGLTMFNMHVYNRWGQMIFEATSLDGAGWDGKLNGIPQPEGVYVYSIDAVFKDGQIEHHKGNVTLMR
jgi:gliding motility-associated-like protein